MSPEYGFVSLLARYHSPPANMAYYNDMGEVVKTDAVTFDNSGYYYIRTSNDEYYAVENNSWSIIRYNSITSSWDYIGAPDYDDGYCLWPVGVHPDNPAYPLFWFTGSGSPCLPCDSSP